MVSRAASAMFVASVLAFGMTGCVAAADAKPSATKSVSAFKTDAEAYKAAENVYMAYIDATNAVDYARPSSLERALELATGDANAADRKSFSEYHADGVVKKGKLLTRLVEPVAVEAARHRVTLAACIDVSNVALTYPDGTSAVSPDREPIQKVLVTLVASASSSRTLLVSQIDGRDSGPACN